MGTATVSSSSTASKDVGSTISQLLGELQGGGGIQVPEVMDPIVPLSLATGSLNAVRDAQMLRPKELQPPAPKALAPALTYEQVTSKDLWGSIANIVAQVAPVVISAVTGKDFQGKDYHPQKDPAAIVNALPQSVASNKDFWDAVGNVLENLTPIVLNAVAGKDYDPTQLKLDDMPKSKDIDWGQVAGTAVQVLPFVLSLL